MQNENSFFEKDELEKLKEYKKNIHVFKTKSETTNTKDILEELIEKSNIRKIPKKINHLIDLTFINKVIDEDKIQMKNYHLFEDMKKEYKKLFYYILLKKKNIRLLTKIKLNEKNDLLRECSILFKNNYDIAQEFFQYTKKINIYYLESIKEQISISSAFDLKLKIFGELLKKNRSNLDFLTIFQFKVLPEKLRILIFDLVLVNVDIENEYLNLKNTDYFSTISTYDNRIWQDLTSLLIRLKIKISNENISLTSAKKILSYYERKKNKLVNDNLYHLSILVVIVFENDPWKFGKLGELIGNFFLLIEKVTQFINPGFEFIVYEKENFGPNLLNLFYFKLEQNESLEIKNKILFFFKKDCERKFYSDFEKIFAEIIKKYVQTFGLNILNTKCSLFLFDQFLVFINKNKNNEEFLDILLSSLFSVFWNLKDHLLHCKNFEDFITVLGSYTKQIDLHDFISKFPTSTLTQNNDKIKKFDFDIGNINSTAIPFKNLKMQNLFKIMNSEVEFMEKEDIIDMIENPDKAEIHNKKIDNIVENHIIKQKSKVDDVLLKNVAKKKTTKKNKKTKTSKEKTQKKKEKKILETENDGKKEKENKKSVKVSKKEKYGEPKKKKKYLFF